MQCKGEVTFSGDIGVLGTGVRELLVIGFRGMDAGQLALDIEARSGIKNLSIDASDEDAAKAIESILSVHKPSVEMIDLNTYDAGPSDASLRKLAELASDLLSFEYIGIINETSVLEAIVSRALLLENAFIGLPDCDDERLTDVLRSFTPCPNLSCLAMDRGLCHPVYIDKIANLVRRWRLSRRAASLSVCLLRDTTTSTRITFA